MRVSSYPAHLPGMQPPEKAQSAASPEHSAPQFQPFCAQAFALSRQRRIPVLLIIGDIPEALTDPALSLHIRERTIPVHLEPGIRPDVELLCQRAAVLFSGEGALPLCALLLGDGRPFLAAPLPPRGYPLEPARLLAWLTHADRRLLQNPPAVAGQASETLASFCPPPLKRPYAPQDAAHDLSRALERIEDRKNGGFGDIKAPFVTGLHALLHSASQGDSRAHASLSRALDAMLASEIHDPLDGSFFRAALTDDWRAFLPEKPLGINAMLALILLESGRRSEAVRTLDFILNSLSIPGGALIPHISASRQDFAFTPEQVCAALGSEQGLRACRLLSLLHQKTAPAPDVTPSRFSPEKPRTVRRLSMDLEPLCPRLASSVAPEDAAFLRRAFPALLRIRSARSLPRPSPVLLTADCALAAAVLAACGIKLGEARYIQAAERAVTSLLALPPAPGGLAGLPPACAPLPSLPPQATCGASAALCLALLTLAKAKPDFAPAGLRLLSAALHAFTLKNGLVMHTPQEANAPTPRMPAIYDSELPSAAALLVRALRLAHAHQPQAGYPDAISAIWDAAAPAAKAHPLSCAALIDACRI